MWPLRIGSSAEFARVATFLRDSGFDEPTVSRALSIDRLSELGSVEPKKLALGGLDGRVALLIRLFLLLEPLGSAEVEDHIEPVTLTSFRNLDLLRVGPVGADDHDRYYPPVLFYPVAGLMLASDRTSFPDGSRMEPPPDVVFPGFFVGTYRFLRVIAQSPTASALDLGTGSGIAALVLARTVERVVATDITARAAHFASFNRLLNGALNVEVRRGDLYEPVAGRTFDR